MRERGESESRRSGLRGRCRQTARKRRRGGGGESEEDRRIREELEELRAQKEKQRRQVLELLQWEIEELLEAAKEFQVGRAHDARAHAHTVVCVQLTMPVGLCLCAMQEDLGQQEEQVHAAERERLAELERLAEEERERSAWIAFWNEKVTPQAESGRGRRKGCGVFAAALSEPQQTGIERKTQTQTQNTNLACQPSTMAGKSKVRPSGHQGKR